MKLSFCLKCNKRIADEEIEFDDGRDAQFPDYCPQCAEAARKADPRLVRKTPRSGGGVKRATPHATGNMLAAENARTPSSRVSGKKKTSNKSGFPLIAACGAAALAVGAFALLRGNAPPPAASRIAAVEAAEPAPAEAGPAESARSAGAPVNASERPRAKPGVVLKDGPMSGMDPRYMRLNSNEDMAFGMKTEGEQAATQEYAALERRMALMPRRELKTAALEEYLRNHGAAIAAQYARRALEALKNEAPLASVASRSVLSEADRLNNTGAEKQIAGDIDGALADFNKALELDPNRAEPLNNRAFVLLKRGDAEGAIADCERALTLDGRMWAPLLVRSMSYKVLGRDAEAAADLKHLREILPPDRPVNQANYDLQCAQSKEARAARAAGEKEPAAAEEFAARGERRLAAGRIGDAARDFEQAVKLDPALGAAGLCAKLAGLADDRKDWKARMGYLKQWAELAPESPDALHAYAWELMNNPDASLRSTNTALPMARKAAELSKHAQPQFVATLAQALYVNGARREAFEMQKTAIARLPAGAERKIYDAALMLYEAALVPLESPQPLARPSYFR